MTDTVVVAWEVQGCKRGGTAPLWDACAVRLRGFSATDYLGKASTSGQAEARWQLSNRWGIVGFAGAGYGDDNNTYTDPVTGLSTSSSKADLDSAEGFEVSAGVRGKGLSVDVEYNLVSGDTVDSTFTGGLYRNGTTDLDKYQIEGGYMLPNSPVELAARYQSLDADNYEDAWNATEVGLNYFWNKHKVKVQFTYRMGENVNGKKGVDADTVLLQWQFVF